MARLFLVRAFSSKRMAERPRIYRAVLRIIQLAAEKTHVQIDDPERDHRAGPIWEQIRGNIEGADLVVVFVGDNWNVLIELGAALGLSKRSPILVCRSVPEVKRKGFDVSHLRLEPYGGPSLRTLEDRLANAIRHTLREPEDRRTMRRERRPLFEGISVDERLLTSGFKDRIEVRQRVRGWLADEAARLICVWGRPGIGRTSVVRKVLWDMDSESPATSGIQAAICLSARDRSGAPRSPAALLDDIFEQCVRRLEGSAERRLRGLWDAGGDRKSALEALAAALARDFYVLAIDDIECALDESGAVHPSYTWLSEFLDALLPRQGQVRILFTSERELRVSAEQARYVRQEQLREGLPTEDAIELLREMDLDGRLGLSDAPREQLEAIVRVTCGVPRALQLVFRVLQENRTERLEQLSKKFFQIESVVRDLASAQLQELEPEARMLVNVLAVVGRGILLEALQRILSPDLESDAVAGLVGRLVPRGLVHIDGTTRLLSVDPIDQGILRQQLPARGPWSLAALNLKAAEHFASCRKPEESWHSIDDVEPQLAEFQHRVAAEDFDGAARVLDEFDYGWLHHHKFEARMLLWGHGRTSIAMRESLVGKLSLGLELRNLAALGWMCRRIGDAQKARQYLDRGEACAPSSDDPVGRMFVRTELGFVLNDQFVDRAGAVGLLSQVKDEALRIGERYWEGMAELGLAYAEFDAGNDEAALTHATDALAAFRAVNRPLRILDALVRIGMIHRKQKEHTAAFADAAQAIVVARQVESRSWEAEVESAFGFHHRGAGDYRSALDAHTRALRLFALDSGAQREEAVQHSYRANLLLDLGRIDEAIGEYRSALLRCREIGVEHEQSWILAGLGSALAVLGCFPEAMRLQARALEIVEQSQNLRSQILRLSDLAQTALLSGDPGTALDHVQAALTLAARVGGTKPPGAFPDAFVIAPYLADALPHEQQSPGDHERRGLVAAQALLRLGRIEAALAVIVSARRPTIEVVSLRHRSTLLHAIICHRLDRREEALDLYRAANDEATALAAKDDRIYAAHVTRGVGALGESLVKRDKPRLRDLAQARRAFDAAEIPRERTGAFLAAVALLREIPCVPRAVAPLVALTRPKTPPKGERAALARLALSTSPTSLAAS